jgi:hypothetical protein
VDAVDALSDSELQERLWLRGERLNEHEPGFSDAVAVVIDELENSNPAELIGYVLRDERELVKFERLAASLNDLVDLIGPLGSFQDAVNTGKPWAECVNAARSLRVALRS